MQKRLAYRGYSDNVRKRASQVGTRAERSSRRGPAAALPPVVAARAGLLERNRQEERSPRPDAFSCAGKVCVCAAARCAGMSLCSAPRDRRQRRNPGYHGLSSRPHTSRQHPAQRSSVRPVSHCRRKMRCQSSDGNHQTGVVDQCRDIREGGDFVCPND